MVFKEGRDQGLPSIQGSSPSNDGSSLSQEVSGMREGDSLPSIERAPKEKDEKASLVSIPEMPMSEITKVIHVLLIEDDPDFQNLVKYRLEEPSEGKSESEFVVEVVGTLREAKGRLRYVSPDVVFVDLALPDSSGIETVCAILNNDCYSTVVLTNYDDEEMALGAVALGAEDYVVKSALGAKTLKRIARYAAQRFWCRRAERERVRGPSLYSSFLPKETFSSEKRYEESIQYLYSLIGILFSHHIPLHEMIQATVEILPSFTVEPARFGARIRLTSGESFATSLFDAHRIVLSRELSVGERVVGTLEVCRHIHPTSVAEIDDTARLFFAIVTDTLVQQIIRRRDEDALRQAKEAAEALAEEQAEALIRADRLAAIGGLAAGIAHDVATPLMNATLAHSILQEKYQNFRTMFEKGGIKKSDLTDFLNGIGEVLAMIGQGLTLARDLMGGFKILSVDQSSERRRRFRLADVIEQVLMSLRPHLKRTPHRVELVCPRSIEMESYPGAISQIVLNLIQNSLVHAFEEKQEGHIRIVVSEEGDEILLRYTDDGKGIPSDILPKVFDRFFTTRKEEGGSGLGLYLVKALTKEPLGGAVDLQSEVGKGVSFEIRIPKKAP